MGSVAGKSKSYVREPYHAGSWYSDDGKLLNEKLEKYLVDAVDTNTAGDRSATESSTRRHLRGLIVPHAGYAYSAPTAAYSYRALRDELGQVNTPIKRILVLHPSHHVYLDGCAVSGASQLDTPVGSLTVDDELRQEILALHTKSKQGFSIMSKSNDEREHSGEMQYPYLAKILADTGHGNNIPVLPVMCGALSTELEAAFGKTLAEIIARPDVFTIVSSDFCHWGARFSFQPTCDGKMTASGPVPIYQFIENLDRRGMDLIQLQNPGAFAEYLNETRNTICGRHAIAVWLRAISESIDGSQMQIRFVRYAQSSQVKSITDSSVSYAAAIAVS